MLKNILACFAALTVATTLNAQNMVAEKMSSAPMDLSASVNKRVDFNGEPCALIKVSITASNASFGGNVVGDVQRDGSDYWVYVTSGTKMLQVKHPNYKTLLVTFPDLGIKNVEGKQTYILDITLPYYAPETVMAAAVAPSATSAASASTATPSTPTPYKPRTFKPRKVKDYTSLFFPLQGFTLGKTKASDALKMGYKKSDEYYWNEYRLIEADGLSFWTNWSNTNADKETYGRVRIDKIPKQWADEFGIDKDMSYNEWLAFFKSLGCRIDVAQEPTIADFKDRDVLKAFFRATTPDGKYYFNLDFNYGNYEGAGTTPYSPGSLYELEMIAPANDLIASKLASSKGASAKVKPSTSIDVFFPVYGLTLGKTTWKDMADAGFNVKFYDKESVVGEALGLNFWDHDGKKYFTDLHMVNSANMPVDWIKLGFQWGNSYDTWHTLLRDLGYSIVVEKEPQVKQYSGRDVLAADVRAISPDGRLRIDLNFNYGDHGATTSSPGTLYSMDMRIIE